MTVVMPVHNREAYVAEAIGSVLGQTHDNLELVVVDDGSTDGTLEVVERVIDPRLRCLRQPHRGISAAMNAGIRAARGSHLARLDSDDVWLPELLATQLTVLAARPDAGVAYARAQGMEHDGRLTSHVWGIAPRYPDDPLRSMLYGDFTCNITVVARRACVEAAGLYDETLRTNEDWDLWLRVARRTGFAFTDRILARFRWHDGNITGPRSPLFRATLEERVRILDRTFADPALPAAARAERGLAYRNLHTGVGLLWLGVGEYREAGRAFRRAIASSGSPAASTVRIAWFVLDWQFLSRRPWGRRLIDWQSRLRRRWRERHGHAP